jgi:hypothetical protein
MATTTINRRDWPHVRIHPVLYARLADLADLADVSLSQYVNDLVKDEVYTHPFAENAEPEHNGFEVGDKVWYACGPGGEAQLEGVIDSFRRNRCGTDQAVVKVPGPRPTRHVNTAYLHPCDSASS